MVAGHTDNQLIAGREVREKISQQLPSQHRPGAGRGRPDEAGRAARAADGRGRLRRHQPIAPNTTAADRQKNRRVEIFVMAPDVPVVGWSDSTPSVYAARGQAIEAHEPSLSQRPPVGCGRMQFWHSNHFSAPDMKSSRLRSADSPCRPRWLLRCMALGSLQLAVALIAIYAVVLAWATLIESRYGAAAAHFGIYDSRLVHRHQTCCWPSTSCAPC